MVNEGDTAWVLISAALVLIMTPALGFFYGGMVRRKNIAATIMQCFIIVAVISVQWVLWGYSLAFGPDKGGFIGGLEWAGLSGVGLEPSVAYATTIPHQAFMIFQAMFAIITPALIIGAFAERIKFKALLIFIVLWFGHQPVLNELLTVTNLETGSPAGRLSLWKSSLAIFTHNPVIGTGLGTFDYIYPKYRLPDILS